jgi:hypothetical protein
MFDRISADSLPKIRLSRLQTVLMPFASSAPYKLVKRKRMEPKSKHYSILISGKLGANPAPDAGFGGIPWGADSEAGPAGRRFGADRAF